MSKPPVPIVVHVYAAALMPALQALVEERAARGAGSVYLERGKGPLEQALEDAAKRRLRGPIGFVVESEAAAIEAISLGADEAVALKTVDEPTWVAFLDRVILRANMRREAERVAQDVAHSEKLTALGTLVAGVAHELNNPLSAITMVGEFLRNKLAETVSELQLVEARCRRGEASVDEVADVLAKFLKKADQFEQMFDEVESASDLLAQLVRDLRVFSRASGTEQPTVIEPAALIEQSLRLVRREIVAHGVIEKDFEGYLPQVVAPRNRLTQVLTNLLVNASQAIAEVQRDVHSVRISVRHDEQYLAISVEDTGPGISEEALERIFDPFFTTKREGIGTGLGLSISRSTLRSIGGDLLVSSVYGAGATFICLIPLPTSAQVQAASAWAPSLSKPREDTKPLNVLLVDDDQRIVRAAARVLQGKHRVLIAHDGQEAIDLLSSGSTADVVVLELDVPEVDGVAFYRWLEKNRPELAEHVVVATAAQERVHFQEFIESSGLPVLFKPFNATTLRDAVERAVLPERHQASSG